MCFRSAALASTAPAWPATRDDELSAAANSSASSPSTNTAEWPRKCAPTTVVPAAIMRARSAMDGVLLAVIPGPVRRYRDVAGQSRGAFRKAVAAHGFRQFAADEHEPALARFVGTPIALMIAIEHHVDALESKSLGIVLEGKDTLGAQNLGALLG